MDFYIDGDVVCFGVHCSKSPVFKYNLVSGELLGCSQLKLKHIKSVIPIVFESEKKLLVACPKGLLVGLQCIIHF